MPTVAARMTPAHHPPGMTRARMLGMAQDGLPVRVASACPLPPLLSLDVIEPAKVVAGDRLQRTRYGAMEDSDSSQRAGRVRRSDGPVFDVAVSKLRRPRSQPGTVLRPSLIERLAEQESRPIV